MNYLSLAFAGFVLAMLSLYYLLPKKVRPYVLLCGSLFFYGCFALAYIPFLLFVAVSSFFCAAAMARSQQKKWLLIGCIVANFLVWFCVKDLQWLLHLGYPLSGKLGFVLGEPAISIIVPVGISYYTLMAIGYLADVYTGKHPPERNFFKYLLFLSYFPGIVQGPISRYHRLMPQLLNTENYRFDTLRDGLLLVLVGIMKKMVIADRLGIFVNACFSQYRDLAGIVLYLGAVCYSFQLYFDFSGCVDLCRGVSGMFGIQLTQNFDRPYLARSVKEFWGKWHMSLSSWLKDYVYIPLGGNRKGSARKYINLLITFLVSGLWHGAGVHFLLWGALHALYQIVGQATQRIRGWIRGFLRVEENSLSHRIFQTVITFHLVTLAWIFFRSESIGAAFAYLGSLFSTPNWGTLFDGSLNTYGVTAAGWQVLVINLFAVMLLECRSDSQVAVLQGLTRQHLVIRWIVYWLLLFDVILFGVYGSGYSVAGFMYGGF